MDRRLIIIAIAAATLIGWRFPEGRLALYPFTILATFVHEMGHGLTALLTGGRFHELLIHPDTSGLATTSVPGRLGRAAVAAGGLLGPSLFAAFLMSGPVHRRPRFAVAALGAGLCVSVILFVRSPFGIVAIGAWGLGLIAVARRTAWSGLILELVAVQMALSVFLHLDYMFSPGGRVDGVLRRSDVGAMEDALLLPYWFWGALTAGIALFVVGLAFMRVFRSARRRAPVSAARR